MYECGTKYMYHASIMLTIMPTFEGSVYKKNYGVSTVVMLILYCRGKHLHCASNNLRKAFFEAKANNETYCFSCV